MKDIGNFFEIGRNLLMQPVPIQEANRPVLNFLHSLEYIEMSGRQPVVGRNIDMSNACSLLRLAARFDRFFQLPMPHGPGAFFFGGIIPSANVGNGEHGNRQFSVGGRGLTAREAFESCVGEAAELLSFAEWENDPLICQQTDGSMISDDHMAWLNAGMGLDRYDSGAVNTGAINAGNTNARNTSAGNVNAGNINEWVVATSITGENQVLFPAEFVLRRAAEKKLGKYEAESNGVGAGPSFEHALRSGLMELVERDAAALWWYGGEEARAVDPGIERAPSFRDFLASVRKDSIRRVWFLDITSDIGVPVIAALSCEPDGTAVVAGYAADLTFDSALRKATLEMCQMELAQALSLRKVEMSGQDDLTPQDRLWVEQYAGLDLAHYPRLRPILPCSIKSLNDPQCLTYDEAVTSVADAGFDIYTVRLYREAIEIPVARVIVPGFQSSNPNFTSQRLVNACQKNDISPHIFDRTMSPV